MTAQARVSEVVSKTADYSFVNLTRLNWNQPLVASSRLLLASGTIANGILVRHDQTPFDDGEIRQFLTNYDQIKSAFAKPLDEIDADADVDIDNDNSDDNELYETDVSVQLSDGAVVSVSDVIAAHRLFCEEMYNVFEDRSRAGAIVSVLFAELGWQVRIIADVLNVSRPTVNKWVMTHVQEPLSEEDVELINKALSRTRSHIVLVDVRNTDFRTRRSGLTWRKIVALPTPEVASIMRALWRVSYRARGSKSTREERVCSLLLDLMLDLLIRRGMTAQNIATVMGVTHRAVFARLERSEALDIDTKLWSPAQHISPMIRGFVSSGDNVTESLYLDADVAKSRTVSHRANSTSVLLRVKTHAASAINPTPIVSVYALTIADGDSDRLASDLLDLDYASPNELSAVIKKIARGSFRPVEVDNDDNVAVKKIASALANVRRSPDDLSTSPDADEDVAAAMFGVDRYWFPSIEPRQNWKNGTVFTEALLIQATGQYDRDDDNQSGTGRPGFGSVTYHWVPSTALDRLIHIGFRDQITTEIDRAKTDVNPEDGMRVLQSFLPPVVMKAVRTWLDETEVADDYERSESLNGKSLLWSCVNDPRAVIELFAAPKTFDNDSDTDSSTSDDDGSSD